MLLRFRFPSERPATTLTPPQNQRWRWLLLPLCLISLFVGPAVAAKKTTPDSPKPTVFYSPSWLFHERVVFERYGDPSLIWLGDGRSLHVVFGAVSWQQVDAWEKGRIVLLAYGADTGPVLHDPVTKAVLPILDGWGPAHPIDSLLEQAKYRAESATAIMLAYHENTRLWQGELARLQRLYISVLPDRATQDSFQRWQATGREYRAAAAKFSNLMLALPVGTMAGLSQAAELNGRLRTQVIELNRHLETLLAAGWWEGSLPPLP